MHRSGGAHWTPDSIKADEPCFRETSYQETGGKEGSGQENEQVKACMLSKSRSGRSALFPDVVERGRRGGGGEEDQNSTSGPLWEWENIH